MLENDDNIGQLLLADERYAALVERCEELQERKLEVKEEQQEPYEPQKGGPLPLDRLRD